MKWLSHLKTINHHKWLVLRYCFRLGLYRQGITHDLSKYSPVEFLVGARYYQGNQSPNNMERRVKGYSSAWLHHKGRNKHHLEYWTDYAQDGTAKFSGVEMPVQYVVEMFCDRIAASRTYLGERYRDSSPYEYYQHSRDRYLLHPQTQIILERMLLALKEKGETEAFAMIRKDILKR